MGEARAAPAAKLFIAMLIAEDGRDKIDELDRMLIEAFGPIDQVSPLWPFEFTDYYADEMGANLSRRIVSFETPFDPADLTKAKLTTNALEEAFARRHRLTGRGRIANLDAGYLALGQIVLATTKSYSHRIYLRDGIWAEVTLRFHKGRYEKWPWTYPDYAEGRYNGFWLEMRDKLKPQTAERSSDL
jgi:hypothetical protein